MVKRTRPATARKITAQIVENASARPTSRTSSNQSDDDMLAILANAHENRRACQVTEWERAQSLYVRQIA